MQNTKKELGRTLKKFYSKFDVHKEKRRLLCEMLREETDLGYKGARHEIVYSSQWFWLIFFVIQDVVL